MLLRHAKSDWPEGVRDHERPLGARGRRDAPAVGRWLRAEGYRPDHVVCSTALRTRQTWELVQSELGADPSAVFEPRVYAATPQELAEVIGGASESAWTLLVIGHNPGIEELALTLADSGLVEGERSAALDRMRNKFPTAAIAVFEWSGGWDQLFPGVAHLARFVTPADL